MTLDLKELKRLADAATKGVKRVMYSHGGSRFAIFDDQKRRDLVADFYNEADGDLFEQAPYVIPALIDEVERLREALRLAEWEIEKYGTEGLKTSPARDVSKKALENKND